MNIFFGPNTLSCHFHHNVRKMSFHAILRLNIVTKMGSLFLAKLHFGDILITMLQKSDLLQICDENVKASKNLFKLKYIQLL